MQVILSRQGKARVHAACWREWRELCRLFGRLKPLQTHSGGGILVARIGSICKIFLKLLEHPCPFLEPGPIAVERGNLAQSAFAKKTDFPRISQLGKVILDLFRQCQKPHYLRYAGPRNPFFGGDFCPCQRRVVLHLCAPFQSKANRMCGSRRGRLMACSRDGHLLHNADRKREGMNHKRLRAPSGERNPDDHIHIPRSSCFVHSRGAILKIIRTFSPTAKPYAYQVFALGNVSNEHRKIQIIGLPLECG